MAFCCYNLKVINVHCRPEHAEVGDVLVLTKALGVQVAVSAYTWMDAKTEKWDLLKAVLTEEEVRRTYEQAVDSMTRLNKVGTYTQHLL